MIANKKQKKETDAAMLSLRIISLEHKRMNEVESKKKNAICDAMQQNKKKNMT